MIKINEVFVGNVPELNNLGMYRKFSTFAPELLVSEDNTILGTSKIRVWYHEYVKQTDGTIYQPSLKHKSYIVTDVPASPEILDEGGNTIVPVQDYFPAFTQWLTNIARTPINPETSGLLDSIEYVIGHLPINIPDGYTLTSI